MARRNGTTGPVVVTGPGQPGKNVPNIGAGLAYAMHLAMDCHDGDGCTWYVRGQGQALAVTKDADGNVTYIRVGVTA